MKLKKSYLAYLVLIIILASLFAIGCGGSDKEAAKEEVFPTKPITLIQWNEPGSGGDIVYRTISKLAQEQLGVPINLENRTGGNGAEALNIVMKAPADGYTISHWSASLSGFMNMPGFPVKAEDFDYLVRFTNLSYMLCVNSELPIQNAEEFIEYAKVNPGQLTVSGSRIGSIHHQNLFAMCKEIGIDVVYVPAEGGSAALANALGGHVDGLIYRPSDMLPYVKEGTLRPILLFDTERDPNYPGVPTIKEIGLEMNPFMQSNGIMIKKGASEEVKQIIIEAFERAREEPEYQEYLKKTHQGDGKIPQKEFEEIFLKEVKSAESYLREIGVIE
ncbi:MAG: tripartite tricarboxylate transporter substrate binding protein [Peptococcales bacterium]|jgi:tripartite-type tricarboxylate transporter receptor subunit TctC